MTRRPHPQPVFDVVRIIHPSKLEGEDANSSDTPYDGAFCFIALFINVFLQC